MHSAAEHDPAPEFHAVHTPQYLYVEYSDGEKELYDLKADPYELHNTAAVASSSLLGSLHQRVVALETCRGEGCRKAESAST
jgi:hypothetical protein